MFLLRRPSAADIDRFVHASEGAPLSFGAVGGLTRGNAGHDFDETVVAIGHGTKVFERGRAALRTWRQFEIGWVELHPKPVSIEPGSSMAVLIRHFGFWSLNGARVTWCTDDGERRERFGVAYATLSNHAESGEELFEILRDPASDEVSYRISACSRPRAALARLGYPVVRRLQKRFRLDSAAAVARSCQPPAGDKRPVEFSK